jgi:hypothetical protein
VNQNNITTPPSFQNAPTDLSLQPGSLNINAGIDAGYTTDILGNAIVIPADIGAYEFTPSLTLYGTGADQAINLIWTVNTTLPTTATWTMEYYTTPANILTVTDPSSTTRSYTLTNLTNYEWYTVTLSAMLNTTAIFSDTVTVMPTDKFVYLPLILKEN